MEPLEKCLHELFEEQVTKCADKVAIVNYNGRKLLFSELKHFSDIISENLRYKGCKRDSVVGIYMERSLEYALSYVSILKAGGAYLPMELSYPKPLLDSVIEDSCPVAIITTPEYEDQLPSKVPVIVLEEGWDSKLIKENAAFESKLPALKSHIDDLAYVVYSSGTTGKPKGMLYTDRGKTFRKV